jgi:hypothetical protein
MRLWRILIVVKQGHRDHGFPFAFFLFPLAPGYFPLAYVFKK